MSQHTQEGIVHVSNSTLDKCLKPAAENVFIYGTIGAAIVGLPADKLVKYVGASAAVGCGKSIVTNYFPTQWSVIGATAAFGSLGYIGREISQRPVTFGKIAERTVFGAVNALGYLFATDQGIFAPILIEVVEGLAFIALTHNDPKQNKLTIMKDSVVIGTAISGCLVLISGFNVLVSTLVYGDPNYAEEPEAPFVYGKIAGENVPAQDSIN